MRFAPAVVLAVAAVAGGLAAGRPAPASAFELPGLVALAGVEDPFAAFPDTLPRNLSATLDFATQEIYRSRKGPRLHDYGAWNVAVLGLARAGPAWVGIRSGKSRLRLVQRAVYGDGDALDGGREHVRHAVAVAGRQGPWEVRGLAGGSAGPEGALEVRTAVGPFVHVVGRGWIWRSTLRLAQTFDNTTFYFPFRYRDQVGELSVRSRPVSGYRLRFDGRRQMIVGEKPNVAQYNLLHVSRWSGHVGVERTRAPLLDARFAADRAVTDVIMALDGTRYADMRDLRVVRWQAEVGWRPRRNLRLAAGFDRWKLASDYPGYFDVWPFTVWDVFTATRYRLERADKDWEVGYASASWTPRLSGRLVLAVGGRLERWWDRGMLKWKQRVPVLPPFFFDFEHHEDSLDWPYTHGVQLDGAVSWRVERRCELRLSGQALVPLGREGRAGGPAEESPPPARGEKESSRGGLSLRGSLLWEW